MGTVLYTGDFRFAVGDTVNLKLLYSGQNLSYGLKSIDKIYLDATFCLEAARKLPTRNEVMEALISTIEKQLEKGSKIFLSLSGRGFGAESIFVEIHKRLKQQIHVSPWKYEIYKHTPDIHKAITLNPECAIHACFTNGGRVIFKICSLYIFYFPLIVLLNFIRNVRNRSVDFLALN